MDELPLIDRLSFWAADGVYLLAALAVIAAVGRWLVPFRVPRCGKCRYDMSGLRAGGDGSVLCPECGTVALNARRLHVRPGGRRLVVAGLVGVVLGYGLSIQRAVRDRGWPAAIPSWVLVMVWPVDVGAWAKSPGYNFDDPVVHEICGRLERAEERYMSRSRSCLHSPDDHFCGRMAPGMPDWCADWWIDRAARELNAIEPERRTRLSSDAPARVAYVYEMTDALPRWTTLDRAWFQPEQRANLARWEKAWSFRWWSVPEAENPFDWRRYRHPKEFDLLGRPSRDLPFPLGDLVIPVGERVLVFTTRAGHARFAGMLVGIENPEEPDADDEITDTDSAEPGAREAD